MHKLIFVWCLSCLYFETRAKLPQRSQELSDGSQCTFDVARNTYNFADLLGCMNELAKNLFVRINDRSLTAAQSDPLTHGRNSYQFPYANVIANLFDSDSLSVYRPLDIADNYQLNNPNEFKQFGGFTVNLLDALSSISRHDDLRCVPRILCEVASGHPPGEYKHAGDNKQFGGFGDFGRNAFVQLLAGFDIAETSPVLSLARAAALGYSSGGNPAMCYRAFPRCPRNPDKLVHYLNNHNGGFFRLFSRYPQSSSSYVLRGNSGFPRGTRRKAPPPGIAGAEAEHTGMGELKFDIPVLIARQDYERSFFPKRENIAESSGRVVFPDREQASDQPSENRISKSLSDSRVSDANTFSRDSPLVFPREDQDVRVLRSAPELSDAAFHNEFRFSYELPFRWINSK